MKKWIFIIIGVLVIGIGGFEVYATKTNNNNQQSVIQNRTATVQKGKFEVNVSGTGTVQPVTSEDIKSTINNNEIDEVLVSAGESVTSGEKLITFTDGSDPITAPADGIITTLAVSAGEKVQTGEVVAHLTNYSTFKTVASIDELDIPKIQVGQTATIKVSALSDLTFTGKVTGIANEGTSTNGVSSFDVDISIDNPQNLKVGMSTETSILTASKDNALYVPLNAVHTMNGEKFVLVSSANASQTQSQSQGQGQPSNRVTVKTGLANDDYVEITEGLTEGQVVNLPNLTSSSSTSTNGNNKGMFGGMGGAPIGGGMSGGMGRSNSASSNASGGASK
ncbi:HlyD family efflux transporter periplasmic adaptor subunit [Neobacillus sp. PS3-12]|jgi:multidrug efflux pump subunit AcrA (membrane-fusion protein)|uniref:HlyD family efflux transporter periplasmic adaptor subunit n=1 Tax=Neobacillus sp. PS3-12 TaxID=3070677 RepID=UPI0027E07736|nr:HlyD family efflux transporter periplasmic adaptor subunit [Neobacillus sp. PS3-12]WML51446.1 HlyD family efflux transporter periplasmic adaptor subunit [Neobacillus sp. PS3-12]